MDFKKRFDHEDISNYLPDNFTLGRSKFYKHKFGDKMPLYICDILEIKSRLEYNDEKQNLTTEQIKYVENTMIDFNMLGLGLDDEKKEKVKELNKKLSNQSVDFVRNLS